jgi:hypothetical protein
MSSDSRYVAVPRDSGERSQGDLEDFAAQCEDAECRRDLSSALAAPDFVAAYRNALLRHPREEARFFQFKQRRARERAEQWLAAMGIAFEKETPRARP